MAKSRRTALSYVLRDLFDNQVKREVSVRLMRWLAVSSAALSLLLCGCGGSTQAPRSLYYTTATATYTKRVAIVANNPASSGGTVGTYSVSPALPAGLNFSSKGVISGTPTNVAPAISYTVVASNSAGNAVATLVISVNDQAPAGLSYAPGSAVYTEGVAIAPNTPSSTGGAVTAYSVSPALPAGLSLSASSGIIAGNPTAVTSSGNYTVTASSASGSTTVALSITVAGPPPMAQRETCDWC